MIVEQITNEEDGAELAPSECGIWINAPGASVHFAFESSIDIIWLIHRLNTLYVDMRECERGDARERARERRESKSPVSLEEAKAKFSEMRRMLSESGADGRNQ